MTPNPDLSPVSGSSLLTPPLAAMREPVRQGRTRPLAWRLEQLNRLAALLEAAAAALPQALAADLGKPALEAELELGAVRQELGLTRRRLRRWMQATPLGLPFWMLPGQAALQPEPLGCVLILAPWNYPFQLCLQPLVSALAAGNTVVLKPSELAPRTATLIADLIAAHLAADTVQVVLGEGAVAARLLEERFDHILFTGGSRVARLVMAAAARHLTPVTLELGGKCPAIVLDDADLLPSARRLAWGKSLNAGQTCIAPDHLLVTPAMLEPLVAAIGAAWRRFHGADPLVSPDLAAIVNDAQFARLDGLLEGARQRGQVLVGGRSDARRRRIEPTLLAVGDPDSDPLMQEELFGPLLPVMVVDDLEAALERVRQAPLPLATYLFGGDAAARRRLLESTSSGSVVFDDVVLQGAVAELPFGGVGESGMGRYHGEAGFRTFSHARMVLHRPTWLDPPFRYPPYAGHVGWMRRLLG